MTITEVAEQLKKINSAIIFCHQRPDGDTLSSAFSLAYALNCLGKKTRVVCDDTLPQKFNGVYLLGALSNDAGGEFDAAISVDCASENMIGGLYEIYKKHRTTISIDHHVSNTRYAKYNYVADEAAAAIIVYGIIRELNVEITAELASTLYVGICTDTGNFAHSNTNAKTFETATELVHLGAVPNDIYNAMFLSNSKSAMLLKAEVMSKMKFFEDDKIAIISIKTADFEKYAATREMTEGFIDYPMSINSVEVAISVMQTAEKCFKLSFRSKNTDVNAIAQTFGGGGHIRASGAVLCGFYEDVIDKLVFTVSRYFD